MTREYKRLEREGRVSTHTDPHSGRVYGVLRSGGSHELKVLRDYLSKGNKQGRGDEREGPEVQPAEIGVAECEEGSEKELERTEEVLSVEGLEDPQA